MKYITLAFLSLTICSVANTITGISSNWEEPFFFEVQEGSNIIEQSLPGNGVQPLFYTMRVPEGLEISELNILSYENSGTGSNGGSALVMQVGQTLEASPAVLEQDFSIDVNYLLFSQALIGRSDILKAFNANPPVAGAPTLVARDYALFLNENTANVSNVRFKIEFVAKPPIPNDTDRDGALDALEIAAGFNPNDATSTPPMVNSIGINFSDARTELDDKWTALEAAGYIPQVNWNQVEPEFGTLDNTHIILPKTGVLVDASGADTTASVNATFKFVNSNRRSGRQPDRLYSAYLGTGNVNDGPGNTINRELDLTVSDIPYTNYDLYLYPSGKNALLSKVQVTVNPDGANPDQRTVYPYLPDREMTFVPESRFREGADQRANVLKYSFSNEDSFSINIPDSGGIAGLQIVERNPALPADQVPASWVLIHGPSALSPTGDPDLDGVNNLTEFQKGTNPTLADSDNDGLSDLVETNTGIYIDLNNTGTDPNYDDSDNDGMGDFEELYAFNPSDPNKVDSDDDGLDDKTEREQDLSALDGTASSYPFPQETTPTRFRWTQENLHFLWDHEHVWNTSFSPRSRPFINIRLKNNQGTDGTVDLTMGLFLNEGKLQASVGSHVTGGFASAGSSSLMLRGEEDLTTLAGFSGYGSQDTSDPLTMEVVFTKSSSTWDALFTIVNEATGQEILRVIESNISAHSSIENGTSDWDYTVKRNGSFPNNQRVEDVRFYRGGAPLNSLPFFTELLDTNNDGLPDAWATRFRVTDGAGFDSDGDGLDNLTEYRIGTNPRRRDTDRDRIDDNIELSFFSDPNDFHSRPPYVNTTAPTGGDLDGDGLPDLWKKRFAPFSNLSPNGDPDHDGQTNLQESIAGTDPLNPLSVLSLTAENMGTGLRLSWASLENKRTRLTTSETLEGIFDNIPGATNGMEMAFENPRTFFRLNVEDLDSDNDGLTDAEEAVLGTDPTMANSAGRSRPSDSGNTRTLSGDYVYFLDRYQNNSELADGAPASIPLTSREAARFLMQTTFGPRAADIEKVRSMGIEDWIENQIHETPATHTQDIIDSLYRQLETSARNTEGIYHPPTPGQKSWFMWAENFGTAFARASIQGEDQLRQRVAFALGQIFVISMKNFAVEENIRSIANYHDMLARNAFGNFYDLLEDVTLHPMMGVYLSSLGNLPADPSINRFPDENFGREVMQLFTIGIHEMNNNGTFKLNDNLRIETYTQHEVSEMARVMTGLRLNDGAVNVFGGFGMGDMRMVGEFHDFGEKRLFNDNLIIPARDVSDANAKADLTQALRFLFNHENCPPFICKALIKFLVTDNPSPAYVERVANVFIDDGEGVRGNLEAVWKAILLDPEARDASLVDTLPQFGRLRDPVVRYMHLSRLLRMDQIENLYWWESSEQYTIPMGQFPLRANTVFNFYEPDYQPPGPLFNRSLVGAPFQILDTNTSVAFPNLIWDTILNGQRAGNGGDRFQNIPVYDEFLPYVGDNEALVDHINLVACAGLMKPETRSIILQQLDDPYFANGQNPIEKIAVVLYSAFICPEGAVQK